MKTTSILRLAAASVALSISAHAAEVFSVSTVVNAYPTAPDAVFNAVDADGNPTNAYNIYGTTDIGNGSGWGAGIQTNFDGTTAIIPGQQITASGNTTTYFGPKFYAGVNRASAGQLGAGVIHLGGNGYRIRCNNITDALVNGTAQVGTAQVGVEGDEDYAPASADYAAATTGLGGVSPSVAAIFMFDADTTSLSGEDDNLIFGDADTLVGQVATPNTMLTRASSASYRAMVKAGGQYYAGSLNVIDTTALTGENSSQLDTFTEIAASATWTLMPGIDTGAANGVGAQNLTVDTSASATTVPGYALTNITQVGFLIAATAEISTGGWNFGVRSFTAHATPASAPDPIVWSQDFTSPVTILDSLSGLTGYDHAYTWSKAGEGLTATVPSTVTQDETNDQVVLAITENSNAGQVYLHMVGNREQADSTRRVKPVSHDTTWEIDLLAFKDGDADLMLTTNGFDGYVKSTIAPSGQIKFYTWMADFTHTNFDNFSGPSKLRNNANNPGIVIVSGGTFDPASADPVTITISGNAEGTVNMNTALDAVESVTLTNYGSGYTAQPTVTFAGGGMTVAPEISFNYSTGNLGGAPTIAKTVDLGLEIIPQENGNKFWGVMDDGQIFTYTQSYDSANDSLSYYFSLTNKATGVVNGPHFITTLTAAEHSAGGLGFFDVISGKRWPETPANQKAIEVHLKRYSNADYASATTIGINSISVATIDGDRDGVIDRNDAFPTDPLESVDSDSDGTGDNSDQYDGYNDTVMTTLGSAQSTAADTFSYYVNGNWVNATNLDAWLTANNYSTGGGGGAITQEAYDAALADKAAAETSLANAREARAGSTVIDVANGVATITLTVEQTDNVGDWSSATTSDYDIELGAPAGASFYRFTIPE